MKLANLMPPLALVLVLLAVLILDQTSKLQATSTLLQYEDPNATDRYAATWVNVFMVGVKDPDPGERPYFMSMRLHYFRNHGVAFSLFSSWDERVRLPVFLLIYILGLGLLGWAFYMTPPGLVATRFGLTLMLAGALGNIIDRLRLGYVTDFVDIEWQLFSWTQDFPVFNVADVAINLGLLVVAVDIIVQRRLIVGKFTQETYSRGG